MCTRLRRLRQKHRGLSRRVAAADDDDLFAAAELRFHRRRAVVDAGALEPRRDSSAPASDTRRPVAMMTARAATRRPSSISTRVWLPVARQLGRALRDHDLRAELLRLRVRACGELQSRDAGRESRGSSRCCELDPAWPPGAFDFDHQHVESFGRAVDRGREPGRTRADDDHVAHVRPIDRLIEAEAVGDLRVASDCAGPHRRGRSATGTSPALT